MTTTGGREGAEQSSDAVEQLSETLQRWSSERLGPVAVVADRSRGHGRALVLEVEDSSRRRWFVKRPKGPRSFRREVRAYRRFVPEIPGSAPRLVAVSPDHQALLLSALPGRSADHQTLWAKPEVHRRAGAWLAHLHGVSAPVPVPDLGPDLGRRVVAFLSQATGLVDRPTGDYVTQVGARFDAMADLHVVPCHLDYTQRNWIVDDGGSFGVIDFSASSLALPAEDFSRLSYREWTERPRLQDAFFEGYGRVLDDGERDQLECCTALAAVSGLARARASGSRALATSAHRTLQRLRATSRHPAPVRVT